MLKSLLSNYNRTTNRGTQLYYAILNGDEQCVNSLLGSSRKPSWADVKSEQGECVNLLVAAIPSPNILRAILVNYDTEHDTNINGNHKTAAIMAAVDTGAVSALRILLEQQNHRDFYIYPSSSSSSFSDLPTYVCIIFFHEFVGRAFGNALDNAQAGSIRVLLELCRADIDLVSMEHGLLEACDVGNFEVVCALLEDPALTAVAHSDNNFALNLALTSAGFTNAPEYQAIIDRLMQIPAVAALANHQYHHDIDLANEPGFAENSMMALSAPQLRLIEILKQHYQAEYEDKTWDVLSAEIKSHLEDEYSKHPAIDEHGNALPLQFTSELSEASLLSYYQHPIHTAWRYLNWPNPWMSSQANFVEVLEDGRAAAISEDDKALMGYIWLALNDETVALAEGFTVEGNKILFAQNLSLLGRAHNWDKKRPILDTDGDVTYKPNGKLKREYYDDLEGDKPTCGRGVTQRLLKVFYGHPYVNGPEARTLSAEIMREFMIEHLIKLKSAENEADNLMDRLNTLPAIILKDIHQELSDLLNLYEDYKERELTDDERTQKFNALTTPETQLQAFIERCQLWYGETRINATLPVSFIGHLVEHAGYIPLIQHSLANPLMAFAQKLNKYLKKTVSELESKASRTYFPSSPSPSSSSASYSSAQCVDGSSNSAKRAAPETRKEEPRRSERLRRRQ